MNNERKKLTLPSGIECEIRKPSPAHAGDLSVTTSPGEFMRLMVASCAPSISIPVDGTSKRRTSKLVTKSFDDCSQHETSVDDLDPSDFLELQNAITEFSDGFFKTNTVTPDGEEAGQADASTKSEEAAINETSQENVAD